MNSISFLLNVISLIPTYQFRTENCHCCRPLYSPTTTTVKNREYHLSGDADRWHTPSWGSPLWGAAEKGGGGPLQAGIVDSYPPLLWKRRLTWPAPDVYFVQSPPKGEFNHSTVGGRRFACAAAAVYATSNFVFFFFSTVGVVGGGGGWGCRKKNEPAKGWVFVIGNSLLSFDGKREW